jgi:predicted nuclease of restriction endonuclease-like RecB superfamily
MVSMMSIVSPVSPLPPPHLAVILRRLEVALLSPRLTRFRVDNEKRIAPVLLPLGRPESLAPAEALLGLAISLVGTTRGEVTEALDLAVEALGNPQLTRGLREVLLGLCEFEGPGGPDPSALRLEVFEEAGRCFPVGVDEGSCPRREVLERVALRRGLAAADLEAGLFSDLKDREVLTAVGLAQPQDLVNRYNVALVQTLLAHAEGLELTLASPSPSDLRRLVRWLRFYELLYEVVPCAEGLRLQLDGPLAVLGSRAYGRHLAAFFPALLLLPQFELRATVKFPGRRGRLTLELGADPRLQSWYRLDGVWVPTEQVEIMERLGVLLGDGWTVSEACEFRPLAAQVPFIADFACRGPRREVQVELLWPHRQRGLQAYLKVLAAERPAGVIVCVIKPGAKDKKAAQAAAAAFPGVVLCSRRPSAQELAKLVLG